MTSRACGLRSALFCDYYEEMDDLVLRTAERSMEKTFFAKLTWEQKAHCCYL